MGKKEKPRASKFARSAAKSEPKESNGEEFDYGKWRVTWRGCNESENGSFCFTFAGVGKDKKIGERIQWFSTTGKAVHVSGPRVKKLAMILAGFADDLDGYNKFDPEGVFLDALLNSDLDAAAEYMVEHGQAKKADKALTQLTETEFFIKVTKGGEKDDGGNFHNGEFFAAGDDSDDEDDSEEEDEEPESERKPAKRGKSKRDEDEDEDDEDEDDEDEPESERRPAKKKARRK